MNVVLSDMHDFRYSNSIFLDINGQVAILKFDYFLVSNEGVFSRRDHDRTSFFFFFAG